MQMSFAALMLGCVYGDEMNMELHRVIRNRTAKSNVGTNRCTGAAVVHRPLTPCVRVRCISSVQYCQGTTPTTWLSRPAIVELLIQAIDKIVQGRDREA
jgi:hypothetical protein